MGRRRILLNDYAVGFLVVWEICFPNSPTWRWSLASPLQFEAQRRFVMLTVLVVLVPERFDSLCPVLQLCRAWICTQNKGLGGDELSASLFYNENLLLIWGSGEVLFTPVQSEWECKKKKKATCTNEHLLSMFTSTCYTFLTSFLKIWTSSSNESSTNYKVTVTTGLVGLGCGLVALQTKAVVSRSFTLSLLWRLETLCRCILILTNSCNLT